MKKIAWIGIFIFLTITTVYAYTWSVRIDESYDYLSQDLYQRALELESRYPDIVKVVEFGESFDNKPLFAVQMTKDIGDYMVTEEANTQRTHYYIDGGNHSRETVNPPIVLRMVEDYARDYYDNGYISRFNLNEILKDSVLHFVPLPNPDGFDLVKKGLSSVQTSKALLAIKSVDDDNYTNYKANLRGVDLNRNFPSVHFNLEKKQWEDIWGKYPSWQDQSEPGGEHYSGPHPASEVETKALMDYLIRYDFRQYLTFHSRGNLTYWHKYFYTAPYNNQTNRFANIIKSVNGYTVAGLSRGKGSGYFSDYTAGMTYKPTVTVETTSAGSLLPTIRSEYSGVYQKIKYLPLYLREEGEKTGYHDYKLYRDGIYVRDYLVKDYGDAVAKKYGGYIIKYSGAPQHIDPTLPEPDPEPVPEPDPEPDFPAEDYRIWGSNRYHTAAEIALRKYSEAETVILVRGDDDDGAPQVADALSASGLAGVNRAPILVTPQNRLVDPIADTLSKLNTSKVIIVGGLSAISQGVEDQITNLNMEVTRISGDNRMLTAAEVGDQMLTQEPGKTAIIAGAYALVDSLVAGPLSHKEGYPIFLVNKEIDDETRRVLVENGIENLIIVGGSVVVSEAIEQELREIIGGEITRIDGANRYDTGNILAMNYFREDPEILIVNGHSFVDAVAGSVLDTPIMYTRENQLREEVKAMLPSKDHFFVLGGKAVVMNKVLIEAHEILHQ